VCSMERTIHVSPSARDLPNISTPLEPNKLYFGDNLNVMRTHIADASVDLCYIDPLFNSKRKEFIPINMQVPIKPNESGVMV
jgi:hypothetical protein